MALKVKQVIGATPIASQSVIENGAIFESIINSLVAKNSTSGDLEFNIISGEVVIPIAVSANTTYILPFKINVPVNMIASVEAPEGLTISISFFQQAIDTAAALTLIQELSGVVAETETEMTAVLESFTSTPVWVTGTDYYKYAIVTDPENFRSYKALHDIITSDIMPHLDQENWIDISSGQTEIENIADFEAALIA